MTMKTQKIAGFMAHRRNVMEWPRTRDLPIGEREDFEMWLSGQSRPLIDADIDDQDAYFPWDYERWRREQ